MNGLVLAAGRGNRLTPITCYVPKPLLPVNGRRILDMVIDYLSVVCENIFVVTGYLGDMIERYLKKRYPGVKVLKVNRVDPGNLSSLLVAEDVLRGEDLIIANADHIFPHKVWDHFPERKGPIEIACHRKETREILEDEMKVKVDNAKLQEMEKTLRIYNGAYTGLAYVSREVSSKFWERSKEAHSKLGPSGRVEDVFNDMAKEGDVRVVWIDNVVFFEVDTIEDLKRIWYGGEAGHL